METDLANAGSLRHQPYIDHKVLRVYMRSILGLVYKARCNINDVDANKRSHTRTNRNIMFQDDILSFTGVVLQGFFYGLYSAIFSIYIQHQTSKEGIDKTRNILLYPLCILYILSTATFILDIILIMVSTLSQLHTGWILATIGLCDFISQAILIYRCWIVWGCNIRVIVIPSILALTSLATSLAVNGLLYMPVVEPVTYSVYAVFLTSLAISLFVNGVVTGLIVLRILKVYWEVRPTFEDQTLGIGTKGKIWSIIFILIESGMAIFTIQTIGVVLCVLHLDALSIIIRIAPMFYGIAPTIILVRLSMGLSFHDEKSMVETAASWRFASHNRDLVPSIDIAGRERRVHIGVQ
ncbi:hypothetical protein BYT27DRAFT_7205404 [Phlegmacium glaucopus]|nr:hypothetical protein BYT27DRAFT_7205404 [Phlegmacium glaucopus]